MNPSASAILSNALPLPGRTDKAFVCPLLAAALVAALFALFTAQEGRSATFDPATPAASKSLEAKLQILQS